MEAIGRTKMLEQCRGVPISTFHLPNGVKSEYVSLGGSECPWKRGSYSLEAKRFQQHIWLRCPEIKANHIRRGGVCFGCGKRYTTDMEKHMMAARDDQRCNLGWLSKECYNAADTARKAWKAEQETSVIATNVGAAIMAQSVTQHEHLASSLAEVKEYLAAAVVGRTTKDGVEESNSSNCLICSDTIESKDEVAVCTHGHRFHMDCDNH